MTLDNAIEQQAADQSTGYVHPDDLELQRLEQEAASAEQSAQPEQQEEGQPAQPEQPEPVPPAPEQPKEPDSVHVPKARLDQVLNELRQLRERDAEKDKQLAYFAGQLHAGKPAEAQQSEPPVDPVAEHDAKIDSLYERYDAGEIGMAELRKQERALVRERDAIVAERSKPSPEVIAQQIATDPYLTEKTAQLEAENPWLNAVPPAVVQHSLLPFAYQLLAEQGIKVGADVRSTLMLRAAVVHAGKVLGLDQRGGQPQGQSLPVDNKPPAITPDQRRQKVELARNHPPSMATAGTGASNGQSYTPEDIDKMSDVDLAALPASILEQLAPSR